MAFDTILVEKKEKIATVTLNRPEQMNALDLVMRRELISALTDITGDHSVRVLVLTGAGKAFCAGGDISTMDGVTAPAARDRLKYVQQIVRLMLEMEKPARVKSGTWTRSLRENSSSVAGLRMP